MEARRRRGMKLLNQGIPQAEVARRCDVSQCSVHRWKQQLEQQGPLAWRRRRLGKPPKITERELAVLEAFLPVGAQAFGFHNDLWTLPRIASVLKDKTGTSVHPGHLWRILTRLGWSVQKPETRATQRDEAAIARWKRHTFPALKKKPSPRAAPLFLWTKAG